MKNRIPWIWLLVGITLVVTRLEAQDVIVTNPAWVDPEASAGSALPVFKSRPDPDYPQALEKDSKIQYAIFFLFVHKTGERVYQGSAYSNPYLEKTIDLSASHKTKPFVPASLQGKPVEAEVWYAVIFNPQSAAPKRKDATARLLEVRPVPVQRNQVPSGIRLPHVIWLNANLSDKGQLTGFGFEDAVWEPLRSDIERSLHNWKFTPARRNGAPVDSELKIPVILDRPLIQDSHGTPPRIIRRVNAEYPLEMRTSRLTGDVEVGFVVKEDGSVNDAVVLQTDNPGFNSAAVSAVSQWKYEPATVNGKPVSYRMHSKITFEITGAPSREYAEVEVDRKKLERLPEEFRYDVPPQAKDLSKPVYPYSLFNENANGEAQVAFLVKENGSVGATRIVKNSRPEFGLALAASIEATKFIPALRKGMPSEALLRYEEDFSSSLEHGDSRLLSWEKNHPERIVVVGKLDAPPKAIFRHKGVFPTALGTVEKGSAVVEFLIDEEGTVRLPRVLSSTELEFGYAAVQAVSGWRFEPPKSGGKPVVTRATLTFDFVRPKKTPEANEATLQPTKQS